MSKQNTTLGKLLAWVLRHEPAAIGIELDPAGWIEIDALLAGLERYGQPTTRAALEDCVATDDKQRYTLSHDATRIRAAQGHSIPIELGLARREPPAALFHGTPERFVETILEQGLIRGQRHDVHLSTSVSTATQVGERRGRAVILRIDSGAMHRDGYPFYCSDNGVWLTRTVPPAYLALAPDQDPGQ